MVFRIRSVFWHFSTKFAQNMDILWVSLLKIRSSLIMVFRLESFDQLQTPLLCLFLCDEDWQCSRSARTAAGEEDDEISIHGGANEEFQKQVCFFDGL